MAEPSTNPTSKPNARRADWNSSCCRRSAPISTAASNAPNRPGDMSSTQPTICRIESTNYRPSSTPSPIDSTTTGRMTRLPDKLQQSISKPSAKATPRRLICAEPGHGLEGRWRSAYVADMRILVLRRLLIVLTGLAFLVGAAVQAMPPAAFMASACMGAANTATGDCCANMAMKDHPAPMKQVPCKGISLDCAKEFGCISSPALPAPSTALGSPIVYGHVA